MAQPLFRTVFILIIFLNPCQVKSTEGPQDISPSLTTFAENSDGFPSGCKLYQNRKLLQCRNAQLQAIPELKENWNVEIV